MHLLILLIDIIDCIDIIVCIKLPLSQISILVDMETMVMIWLSSQQSGYYI